MEDYDFVKTCRAHGRVLSLDMPVLSSSRRWATNGVFGNTFRNQLVILGHALGVPLERMVQWYYGPTKKKEY